MSTKLYEAEDLVFAPLVTAVAAFTPGTGFLAPKLYWDDSTEPTAHPSDPNPPKPEWSWLRINWQPTAGFQASLGGGTNTRYRRTGVLSVQVFTPLKKGSLENTRLCEMVLDTYDGKHFGPVWLRNGSVRRAGGGRERQWFLQIVTFEWQFDDVK